jgi:DNA-binding FadR family transcriptional regulator
MFCQAESTRFSCLPIEVDLAQQYGVARMTVRRAVAQLRDKGLVVTVHGPRLLRRAEVNIGAERAHPSGRGQGEPGFFC